MLLMLFTHLLPNSCFFIVELGTPYESCRLFLWCAYIFHILFPSLWFISLLNRDFFRAHIFTFSSASSPPLLYMDCVFRVVKVTNSSSLNVIISCCCFTVWILQVDLWSIPELISVEGIRRLPLIASPTTYTHPISSTCWKYSLSHWNTFQTL